MPNDMKLGLILGLSAVIAVAVTYHQKETSSPTNNGAKVATSGTSNNGNTQTVEYRDRPRPSFTN